MQDEPFRLKRPGLYPETRRIYKHPEQEQEQEHRLNQKQADHKHLKGLHKARLQLCRFIAPQLSKCAENVKAW